MDEINKKQSKIKKHAVWIILFILIILALLWVLSPVPSSPAVPARCAFSGPITCSEFQIIANNGGGQGVVQFTAINQAKTQFNFAFTGKSDVCILLGVATGQTTTCAATCTVEPNNGFNIAPRQSINVTCIFNGTFSQEDKSKVEISMIDGSWNGAIYAIAK